MGVGGKDGDGDNTGMIIPCPNARTYMLAMMYDPQHQRCQFLWRRRRFGQGKGSRSADGISVPALPKEQSRRRCRWRSRRRVPDLRDRI